MQILLGTFCLILNCFLLTIIMLITKSCQCNINGDLAVVYDTPIFHDVKQIMTGYGPLPASEGVSKEVNWGEKNGYRLLLGFGKEFCKETILEKNQTSIGNTS